MDEHPQQPSDAGRPGSDPDDRQALIDAPLDGDDKLVAVTKYQAQKCGAIISAVADGHELYRGYARNVADFLQAAAVEASGATIRPSSAERWQPLANLPWPVPGSPRTQPDVNGT